MSGQAKSSRLVGLPGSGAWAAMARSVLHGREIAGFAGPSFKGPLVLVVKDQEETVTTLYGEDTTEKKQRPDQKLDQ